jgi:hypothetical protein
MQQWIRNLSVPENAARLIIELEDNLCPEMRAILPIVSLPDGMGVTDTERVLRSEKHVEITIQ